MTVYFQGTEREDFFQANTSAVTHSASYYNASYTRCSVRTDFHTSTNYLETKPFSATEFWTHFNCAADLDNVTVIAPITIGWYTGTTPRIGIQFNNNLITLKQHNGSSWVTLDSTGAFQPRSIRQVYDVKIKLGTSGVGEIRVYVNGVPAVSTNSFDTTFGGAVTDYTSVRFTSGADQGSFGYSYYSEVIVADWATLGARLQTVVPNANGNYTAWTGAGYTAVDETSTSGDFMSSNTVDQRVSFNFTDIAALASGESIEAVQLGSTFTRDLSGPQSVNFFTRVSATDYDGADQTPPDVTNSANNIIQSWATNPATSNNWTASELNAAEFGVRSRT